MSQADPVLRYFDCRSRGQALRFALTDRGVAFHDERIPTDELDEFRRTASRQRIGGPFAALPVLAWGDFEVAQTLAIAGFLSERLDDRERSATPEERAVQAMVTNAAHLDMQVPYRGLFWQPADVPTDRLLHRARGLIAHLAARAAQLDALRAAQPGPGPFFGGRTPAMSDYFVYESVRRALDVFGEAFEEVVHPLAGLRELECALGERPAIAALHANGQVPFAVTASPSERVLRERLRDRLGGRDPG